MKARQAEIILKTYLCDYEGHYLLQLCMTIQLY